MSFFIGGIQIILLVAHWALYMTIKRFFGIESRLKIWKLRIMMLFLASSLLLSSLISFKYFGIFARIFYVFSVVWLGAVYFLLLASLLAWLVYIASEIFHFALDRKTLMTVLFSLAGLAALFGIVNASLTRVTRITVDLPNLPAEWQGKRAVWVSDTHLGQVRGVSFAQKIADMIKKEKPEIVFIGGDFYDGSAVDAQGVARPFADLDIPKGVYFVTGNHEQFSSDKAFKEAVQNVGMKVLDNEMVQIGGLQIVGVDYRKTVGAGALKTVLDKIVLDKSKPSILLKHTPLDLGVAEQAGISFQISGHSHQGQVFLFKYITRLVYQGYDYGLKKFGDMTVYTSSGAGTWGPPMRVDTVPEIVVIELK